MVSSILGMPGTRQLGGISDVFKLMSMDVFAPRTCNHQDLGGPSTLLSALAATPVAVLVVAAMAVKRVGHQHFRHTADGKYPADEGADGRNVSSVAGPEDRRGAGEPGSERTSAGDVCLQVLNPLEANNGTKQGAH
jgi:hypothetical protein